MAVDKAIGIEPIVSTVGAAAWIADVPERSSRPRR